MGHTITLAEKQQPLREIIGLLIIVMIDYAQFLVQVTFSVPLPRSALTLKITPKLT